MFILLGVTTRVGLSALAFSRRTPAQKELKQMRQSLTQTRYRTMRFFKLIFLFVALLTFSCCKINQFKNKQKTGRWVYLDTVNNIVYESKGKYKKGIEKKTWNYYANHKRIKKEAYQNNLCTVTNYYENGKIASKGKTKLVVTTKETHWYYFGEWYFYADTGKLMKTKKYGAGELLEEKKME